MNARFYEMTKTDRGRDERQLNAIAICEAGARAPDAEEAH